MSEEKVVTPTDAERMQDVAREAAEDTATLLPPPPPGPAPQQEGTSLGDLRVGYVVGMTDDGNFVFDIFGKQKGLVEVLGLHYHATERVKTLYNQTQMSGDTLVNEVGKALSVLNQKLDAIQQVVAPKKPDNNL